MKQTTNTGFTLIEILVVITILAILTSISFVGFEFYIKKSRDTKRLTNIQQIDKLVKQDSTLNKNEGNFYLYNDEELNQIIDNARYQSESGNGELCYYIGSSEGADTTSAHDNEFVIATWGDTSSTIEPSQEGIIVFGTGQGRQNLMNAIINGDPTVTILREDFLCSNPERLDKVHCAFIGQPIAASCS